MTLFFRAVASPAQAKTDLRRGHSYHDTEEYDEQSLAELKSAGKVSWIKSSKPADGGQRVPAVRLPGLCGFDNPDQAAQFVANSGFGPYVAVYEGTYAGSVYDGDLFKPSKLLEVVRHDDFQPGKY